MERFIERYQDRVVGVLSGFDRMLFRGILRSICHVGGMDRFLSSQGVLYKDFGAYVNQLSDQMKDHAEAVAQSLQGTAASVRVVTLPGLSLKGDIVDWIAAGHTREVPRRRVAHPVGRAQHGGDPTPALPDADPQRCDRDQ